MIIVPNQHRFQLLLKLLEFVLVKGNFIIFNMIYYHSSFQELCDATSSLNLLQINGKYTSKRSQRCDGSNAQQGRSKERGRVKKNLKKKGSVWRLTGAQEHKRATHWRPWGATEAPFCKKKINLRIQGFYTLYKLPNTLKPVSKPHLHQNKVAMLGFTQNLSNPLIHPPFP